MLALFRDAHKRYLEKCTFQNDPNNPFLLLRCAILEKLVAHFPVRFPTGRTKGEAHLHPKTETTQTNLPLIVRSIEFVQALVNILDGVLSFFHGRTTKQSVLQDCGKVSATFLETEHYLSANSRCPDARAFYRTLFLLGSR